MTVQAQYNSTPIEVPDKQFAPLQSDQAGRLLVTPSTGDGSPLFTNAEYLAGRRSSITRTTVNSGTSSVTLISSGVGGSRNSLAIANSDPNRLHVNLAGTTATSDDTSLDQRGYWEAGLTVPMNAVTGIWEGDGPGVAVIYEGALG